jgi:hypothetical protein
MSGRRYVDALLPLKGRGATRLRSNVSLHPDWRLVPGELFAKYRPIDLQREPRGSRLRNENGYYAPCSICRRTVAEIRLEGCTQCPYAPTPDEVAEARRRQEAIVEDARALEERINAALGRRAHRARIS